MAQSGVSPDVISLSDEQPENIVTSSNVARVRNDFFIIVFRIVVCLWRAVPLQCLAGGACPWLRV